MLLDGEVAIRVTIWDVEPREVPPVHFERSTVNERVLDAAGTASFAASINGVFWLDVPPGSLVSPAESDEYASLAHDVLAVPLLT